MENAGLQDSSGNTGKEKKSINVHHLSRVEGHGCIVALIDEKGKVEQCRWEVVEAPRFFEAMLLGRSFEDVHHITSRICGICSIGHQLASLQATEEALNVRVTDQTILLRKLAIHAENLQSHLLHIGYLVLPDLAGVGSVIPLASSHKDEVVNIIGARKVANEFSRIVCGRTTHPQRMIPGGFAKIPTVEELKELRKSLKDSLPKLNRLTDLFASLMDKFPDFNRPTEYIALVSDAEYALYWGQIASTKGQRHPLELYKDITKEYCVPQSTAKWTKNVAESYMVGALSRVNLNYEHLSPKARNAAKKLGLETPCLNPYMITPAQLVECFHSVEDSMAIIDSLLGIGLTEEPRPRIQPTAGKGVGAVEVPRGILFHAYEYDDNGRIVHADCIIPTNQNHANIQKDLEALTPLIANESMESIELKMSMLVRAYDPCISCSTHLIDLTAEKKSIVRFVRSEDAKR